MVEFFRIPHQCISRDDIKEVCPKAGKLSDEQMKRIAKRMDKAMIDDGWWQILKIATKEVLEEENANIQRN